MRSQPFNTLQAGRGLAALAVVGYHCNLILQATKYLGHEVAPLFRAGDAGVQFFFVLSGFVIFLAHRKDIGRPECVGIFLWKRFKRLYPPLWLVLLLIIPIYLAIPSFGLSGVRSPGVILSAFLVTPAWYDHILGPEWTLRHEVLFYAIFAVLIWKRPVGYVLLGTWLTTSAIVPWLEAGDGLRFFFSVNHLLFGLGIVVCLLFARTQLSQVAGWIVCVIGTAIFAAAWWMRCVGSNWHRDAADLLFGVGAAVAILGLINLERAGRLHSPRPLNFLGEASYAIYLVNYPALSVITKVLAPLLRNSAMLFFVIVLIAGVLAGIVFHLLLELPVIRYLNRLNVAGVRSS